MNNLLQLTRRQFGIFHWLALVGVTFLWSCGGNISNHKFYDGTGQLTGSLTLPNGNPASFAKIEVVNLPKLHTFADESGHFELRKIPAGRRDILIMHRFHGLRLSPWILGNKTITLTSAESQLKELATLSGKIEAPHRFGAKGITITIKGTSIATQTTDNSGFFELKQIPAGCHNLLISAPFLKTQQLDHICLSGGESKVLDQALVILPEKSCQTDSDCPQKTICHENFCVPDEGGEVEIPQTLINLDALLLGNRRKKDILILKNKGLGRLHIYSLKLSQPAPIFRLSSPPQWPLILKSGEELHLSLEIRGTTLGTQQATIEMKTSDPSLPTVRRILLVKVVGHHSNCLQFSSDSVELGSLKIGASHRFKLSVYNRCALEKRLVIPKEGLFLKEAGFTPIQIEAHIMGGQSIQLEFDLRPQFFGELIGKILFKSDNTTLQIPVHGYITDKNGRDPLLITPRSLDFGLVAPEETRKLWLHIRFPTPIIRTDLSKIQTSFIENSKKSFHSFNEWIARSPDNQNKDFYLSVGYTAPSSGSLQSAWLVLDHLPNLQGKKYILRVRGSIATQTLPSLPTTLYVGAVKNCDSLYRPIYLMNRTPHNVTVRQLSLLSSTPKDFNVKSQRFPYTIPPHSRKIIAWVQFTPSQAAMKTFAQLKVEMTLAGSPLSPQFIGLIASSGFPYYDVFRQGNGKEAQLYFYIDRELDLSSHIKSSFNFIFNSLRHANIRFNITPIRYKAGLISISPSTNNAWQEMLALMQNAYDPKHRGLGALAATFKRLPHLKQAQKISTPVAIIFISKHDDASPYNISRYLPNMTRQNNLAIFSATPHNNCRGNTEAIRYQKASQLTHGASLDLCSADANSWQRWTQKITNFLLGKRRVFPLSFTPLPPTLHLQFGEKTLPQAWQYDEPQNAIILSPNAPLPFNQQLFISYYTACSER